LNFDAQRRLAFVFDDPVIRERVGKLIADAVRRLNKLGVH
jgi:hypothetical protein